MRDPDKGHSALRRGRYSEVSITYFLTICLNPGHIGLASSEIFLASLNILRSIEKDGHLVLIGLVHMPDHVHLLIQLGPEVNLSNSLRLYKGRMSPVLRKVSVHWQKGYFDRRLRASDPIAVVLRYMLLNPYRKDLISVKEDWPYWFCSEEAKVWMSMGEENTPVPEWLK